MPIKQNPEINQNTNINLAYDKGYNSDYLGKRNNKIWYTIWLFRQK